jgi:hypothetical protein
MKTRKMGKQGGFTDIFIFIIMAFCIMLIAGIFIYIGILSNAKLHETMDNMTIFGNTNVSQVITNSMGQVNASYQMLYWISWFLIIGMIVASFIGAYMATSKPVFIIPYIILAIVAFFVAVGISNAYGTIMQDATLGSTFNGLVGGNFLMGELPIIVLIVEVITGIIMFSNIGNKNQVAGGYYG